MNPLSSSPAFLPFGLAAVLLCANLLFLWVRSGGARAKTQSTPNSEDVAQFGSKLAGVDPEPIARVLRAHTNAQASIYPFLVLGLLYVAAGGGLIAASAYCGIFCLARVVHTVAYLAAKQPWRTVAFVTGLLVTGVLLLHVLWLLLAPR